MRRCLLLLLPFLIVSVAACRHRPTEHAPQAWLLGEVHDNAAGHAARATLLRRRIEAGWRPAIAMEQFDADRQAALDAAMRDCGDADCVIARASPAQASWGWEHYKPVIALALQYRLPLLAANLSRADGSKVVKNGFDAALSPDLVARYRLDALPAAVVAVQEAEVRDSHCGMLPESMVAPMAKAQIARDIVMAETLRAQAGRGVVLIAGNGQVRGDVGVPFWLRRDGLATRAEGFLEPASESRGFDVVHRIPRAERPDPCAGFRAPPGKG